MSTLSDTMQTASRTLRVGLGVVGGIAVVVGLLILLWPDKTAVFVAAVVAIYTIIVGVAYAGMAVAAKSMTGWARAGHVILGVLFVLAGILALTNLAATTVWLAAFVGIAVGILWIVEGVVSLVSLGAVGSNGFTVLYAIISILAGITLLTSPLWGAAVLWWLLGIGLIVLGIVQVIRASTADPRS